VTTGTGVCEKDSYEARQQHRLKYGLVEAPYLEKDCFCSILSVICWCRFQKFKVVVPLLFIAFKDLSHQCQDIGETDSWVQQLQSRAT
jgi:hypothetical protein